MIEVDAGLRQPVAPRTCEEAGVSEDLVLQLVTKALHFAGESTGIGLANRLGVPFTVIESSLNLLKRDRQCEIIGGAGSVLGPPSYRYRITDAGRTRASLFLDHSQYVGHLPVPLVQYSAYMRQFQSEVQVAAKRASVRKAFSKLVLNDRVLDQLGPAIASGHSLFIYGPPGNGKTVISQAIRNLYVGGLCIPHAIEVEGQVVRIFDPVNHEPVNGYQPDGEQQGTGFEVDTVDRRWVRCKRPLVTAGGELTLDSLELGFSEAAGFYRAPLQMLANGGVLVIDDFGRQHATPRDLLNRWIVPLESRVDYLTLRTGQKFELPFAVLVVFATNLRPGDLVDEAFLRRIQYKVYCESPTVDEFSRIFADCCEARGLSYDPALVHSLIATELQPRDVHLRGCQPRDLIDKALALASYLDRPRGLSLDLLSAACASYFVDDRDFPDA
ncbi:MAG: AAA family ATPase [Acidobacteria bacterium]|nr:MAG: AAA family ATPase [Acidobacteriota bacterium]